MGRLVLFYLVPLILTVFCLVDAISSRDDEVRHLPKLWWLILILLFPMVGSLAWLIAGRPNRRPRPRSARERATPDFPEYDRPGRMAASDPAADAEFLRKVRERAEEQRRRAAEQKRREEQDGETPRPDGTEG
ncbi:MAG: PLDc N-terminal domain-containing protein [Nocardioides sp.]